VLLDQIHNLNSYVRDYYCFKRSHYPQLELIHMKPEEAFNALQRQELLHKFIEIGKVLLTWAILKNVDMVSNHNPACAERQAPSFFVYTHFPVNKLEPFSHPKVF